MSVLDQLRALERQVQQRLRELGPLVAEYRDLEKVAERLGLKRDDETTGEATPADAGERAAAPARKPAAKPRAKRTARAGTAKRAARKPKSTAATKATAAAKPRPKATAAAPPKRKPSARKRAAAAPGQRQQDVLRLVRERPGVTVAELAAELGVDATGLYGVVRRLQSKGEITKDGMQLRPVDLAGTPADAASITSDTASGSSPPEASESAQPSAEPPASES